MDAAREATVNAAKWSGADVVSLFAEVEPGSVSLFVTDRGRGFDPATVPSDRKGLAESVQARAWPGAGALSLSAALPVNGAEIGLTMPRSAAARLPRRSHEFHGQCGPPKTCARGCPSSTTTGCSGPLWVRAGRMTSISSARQRIERQRSRRSPIAAGCRAAGRASAGWRRPGRRDGSKGPASGGEIPGAIGIRRPRGRHRGHPGGRSRLRHEDDLRRRARGRDPPGSGRRRGVLSAVGRTVRRLRREGQRRMWTGHPSTRSSTS